MKLSQKIAGYKQLEVHAQHRKLYPEEFRVDKILQTPKERLWETNQVVLRAT